ncbi:hypothetical protein F5Y03DRAFT_388075 [Xylaria venustula]|nr:hypothetical protein F5Y03DRAFT_388075 [Xylaria venustula]
MAVITPWRASSQRVADLYSSGVKLWLKQDLVHIEQQLAQSCTTEKFTVRSIDGSRMHIKNPMYGVQQPICIVYSTPSGPPEAYQCTYLVDWTNRAFRNYQEPLDNARVLFETRQKGWNGSVTCEALTSHVTKIICFGLGDINFKLPDWRRAENESKQKCQQEPETSEVEGALIHYAIALTLADIARSCNKNGEIGVRLLTQDPDYTDESKNILREIGFEVTGEYGAGGFAGVDDKTVVFSAFAAAPVKQIIADLARQVAVIYPEITSDGEVFNKFHKPYADPDSPRTREMWKGYQGWNFPAQAESPELKGSLFQLALYNRIGR